MKSDRVLVVCGIALLGAYLLSGCSNNGNSGASVAKTSAIPAGMPQSAQQQMQQARSGPAPSALAAERSAAMRQGKP